MSFFFPFAESRFAGNFSNSNLFLLALFGTSSIAGLYGKKSTCNGFNAGLIMVVAAADLCDGGPCTKLALMIPKGAFSMALVVKAVVGRTQFQNASSVTWNPEPPLFGTVGLLERETNNIVVSVLTW